MRRPGEGVPRRGRPDGRHEGLHVYSSAVAGCCVPPPAAQSMLYIAVPRTKRLRLGIVAMKFATSVAHHRSDSAPGPEVDQCLPQFMTKTVSTIVASTG